MPTPLTLVIDQGTHATRALVFDETGNVLSSAFRKVPLHGSGTVAVEQNASEILASAVAVIREVLATAPVRERGVARAGLTTQRSSVVPWDRRTGEPLGPMLSWQDRRVMAWLEQFSEQGEAVKRRTGLRLSPHYGAGKLRWYLDHLPVVREAAQSGNLAFGPLAAFLLFNLLEEQPLLVDHVNASRTQLWNLEQRDWDPWLLDLFGVPRAFLPDSAPTCHPYGRLRSGQIPLVAVNGDQNAAIYSLGQPEAGTAIVNIGTGAFILLLTGNQPVQHPTLLSALASSRTDRVEYLVEGTVNGAGSAVEWASNRWNLPDTEEHLDRWLMDAKQVPIFLNTIGGLGSPWWKPGPEATVLGKEEPAQIAVAVIESIIFMLNANLEMMEGLGLQIDSIRASGGLSQLDGLCQRLADLTGRPVYRPAETEATAMGTAWLASNPPYWPAAGKGQWFKPTRNQALAERYHRFLEAIG